MRTIFKLLALIVMTGWLAGCATPVPGTKLPDMTFRHLPPIQLLVSDVVIESTAEHSTQPPHIAHLFPTPPELALRNWARDRLVARGSAGTARFTIVQAEAVGASLDTDGGVTGIFKKELSDRYVGRIDAVLTIYDAEGARAAHVEAKAERSATVREDATLAERRKIMYELVEKMMADFNAEMDRQIAAYLGAFVL